MNLPVHETWQAPLAGVEDRIHAMGDFLRGEDAYLPRGNDILRAFADPFDAVRVLIVGQDPYPTPGHPMGLAFSTQPGVKPPRSLVNIYKELQEDLGVAPRADGDLSSWSAQGILLLNRVLTVRPGAPASHRGKGWEAVTEAAIRALAARDQPLVAILWGRDAQSAARFLGDTPRIESPHPSPLSANRGFFGSRPFSRANQALQDQGGQPVDWGL
ncbi:MULTISPECIES: uracil-DNA glycosylase [Corynebacterium]|uniref:Uracil-DNA glycosylase n=1 Tax=Corynebacterium gottingense TaxID=2041036 RepID=A0ABX9UJJ8_9CORY|nr:MULTISPECIES: uracil-DNA glycosylase [Corynebacterium]MCG7254364.1 uracil-DNA glycosylase [Corynebacterium hadale]MCG7256535.1 uracil-DNA glycosylase [Corynebacterium hadale]MCG7265320.1 uracil-DNA glycosylase [Corynebacterium hadale]PAT15888.1 uracil-DNA glycosylase [Corynebacterium sp. NML 120412]RMD19629.1 uracil-DNA glycosylase [Corynebacterium gottingense]